MDVFDKDTPVLQMPEMTKAKTMVAAVGALVTFLTAAFADDVLSIGETAQGVSVLVESAVLVWAVWRVPNKVK